MDSKSMFVEKLESIGLAVHNCTSSFGQTAFLSCHQASSSLLQFLGLQLLNLILLDCFTGTCFVVFNVEHKEQVQT